ncbi:juvenile hormone esterase-like [Microplitis mediator]|uniref:juvenile hormone esterase-like n=1 Tax=Microplitis mediator TaxID=375433 RepID=UPI002557501C|nr:juvenile hormone esterase-like [Microplitis mediator]
MKPIIEVQEGKLRGIKENNINGIHFYAFRGIPYARPPIGDLRFKDPEPAESWSGVKDAIEYGPKCAQVNWVTGKIVGMEDCLYLNVYTTELNPKVLRAVMFCIHGGNFSFGTSNDETHGPDYLIEKEIVLVTVNYRLGVLGFLNLDDEEVSGNQGFKDLVHALKWVRQNISKFGGDPNNVTLIGHSAGGSSVHYLTVSPLAQGLFHKAILQSGVAINPWARAPKNMKGKAEKLASILGNKISDSKKLVEFLRGIDVFDLIKAQESFLTWKDRLFSINVFGPSVDSKSKDPFLGIPIEEAVKSGIRVPCIIGHVSHEGLIILSGLKNDNYGEINDNQEELLIHPHAKKNLKDINITYRDMKQFFMGGSEISPENVKKFVDLITAAHFVIDIHRTLDIQTKITEVPTFMYKFDHYSKETSMMQKITRVDLEGTCHVEDLRYIYYPKWCRKVGIEPSHKPGSIEFLNHQRFLELWTNFAKTGNPTSTRSELIPFEWQPIGRSAELNCLKISKEFKMIKEPFLIDKISKNLKTQICISN